MDTPSIKIPVYVKLAQIIIGIIGLFFILYIGREIIIPFVFAVIIAILLNPVVNYLMRKKVNRIIAITIALLGVLVISVGLGYFIGSQISRFSETLPQLKEKLTILEGQTIQWVSQTANISQTKIQRWMAETRNGIDGTAIIGKTLGTLKGLLVLIILPVYTFLILFYKPLLLEFISRLYRGDEKRVVSEVMSESKEVVQSYLVGLSIEAVIVATLNSVVLIIIGVDYALLLGIIGALLNLIPYLGGVIAIGLPMLLAIATKTPTDALWVLIGYLAVQFIDNNFLVPKIVASKVKINAMFSILVVLMGGALWGVSGMFLSIPLTAIIKVVFDRIEPLKPFGYLLGDEQPNDSKMKPDIRARPRKPAVAKV
ncbi:AI-2E family transporter [soil metagenome]